MPKPKPKRYVDNASNRRLGRVGKPYGSNQAKKVSQTRKAKIKRKHIVDEVKLYDVLVDTIIEMVPKTQRSCAKLLMQVADGKTNRKSVKGCGKFLPQFFVRDTGKAMRMTRFARKILTEKGDYVRVGQYALKVEEDYRRTVQTKTYNMSRDPKVVMVTRLSRTNTQKLMRVMGSLIQEEPQKKKLSPYNTYNTWNSSCTYIREYKLRK